MVLISVMSVETDNGFQFKNDFAESIIIDPNSRVSLVNLNYERKSEYVVMNGGDQFQVKVGDVLNNTDTLIIPQGTYNANELAQEIQTTLNRHYANGGHAFNVKYNSKDQRFSFQHLVRETKLHTAGIKDWDVGAGTQAPDIVVKNNITLNNPELEFDGAGKGTARYADATNAVIATENIPSLTHGGAFFEMKVNFTGICPSAPVLAQNTASFGMALWSNTLVAGQPTTGVKMAEADMTWADMAIIFTKNAGGDNYFKIFENGVNVFATATVQHRAYTPQTGDMFKIEISSDEVGHPTYWYKRVGDTNYSLLNMTGAIQTMTKNIWEHNDYLPVVFSDNNGANSDLSINSFSYSVPNSNKLRPNVLDTTIIRNHVVSTESDKKALKVSRSAFNGGAEVMVDAGVVSQNVPSQFSSEFSFKLQANNGAKFVVGAVDETTRLANVAGGATIGISDPLYGSTAIANGTTALAPNLNPASMSILFDSANNIIETRHELNKVATFNETQIIRPNVLDITASGDFKQADWTGATDPRFYVRANGIDNSFVITVSPSDKADRDDEMLVYEFNNPHSDFTGIHTYAIGLGGGAVGDYTANATITLQTRGGNGAGATFNATTTANGQIQAVGAMLNGGKGYQNGETYNLSEILADGTRDNSGTGTIQITALTLGTDKFNENNSTRDVNGYRWCYGVRNWVGVDGAEQPEVNGLELRIEEPDANVGLDYAELHPQFQSNFGNMIGFTDDDYYLTSTPTLGNAPQPDINAKLNPSIMVNINNLPIKSYVGMKVKADATLNDDPVGNRQGLTKLVGKVPRFHDDTGVSHSGVSGPFYYDYFPYSLPLKNATELVINELDISLTNPDGTLATDITNTHLLLSITNVDSVGEGLTGGTIGKPIDAPMSYDRLDITKGQLQPTLGGGTPISEGDKDPFNRAELSSNAYTTPL